MKKVISTKEEYIYEKAKEAQSEIVHIFAFESNKDYDEFTVMTHDEQIKALGLTPELTLTDDSEELHRYFIDVGEAYVVVRESVTYFDE